MSQENVEIVRRAFQAFNERDLDALVETYDPAVIVDWSRSPGVEAGIYEGREGARRLMLSFFETWERITASPEEFIDRGDYVVVPNRATFWGREGVSVEARGVFVNTVREGSIVELRLYRDSNEALKAVGLEE